MNFRKNVMGYKQLSIRGTVQINLRPSISSYKIDAQDIQIESHKSLDVYGQAMLVHDLKCKLKIGYFHIVITTDKQRIISVERGDYALGDGLYYELDQLSIRYGKNQFIHKLDES